MKTFSVIQGLTVPANTVVTGASSGIGLAVVQALLQRDDVAQVYAVSRHAVGSEALAALGRTYGNTFRWQYTLQVTAGNPLTRVRMQHWMYLVDGGDTLVNRVVIRKFGAIVGGTTEYFRRGAGETASVGPAASGSPAPPPW